MLKNIDVYDEQMMLEIINDINYTSPELSIILSNPFGGNKKYVRDFRMEFLKKHYECKPR